MTNEFDATLRKKNAIAKRERAERERIANGQQQYRQWLQRNPSKRHSVIKRDKP